MRAALKAAAARHAPWAVPLFLGLLALRRGQDVNWDLLNYHRYNPFALLNGKIGLDLAPGQWQSYFNPAIDLLYHGLTSVLPAPAAGFAMGLLHGLNYVLVLAIARLLLPGAPARVPLLLALAGCFAPGFMSELGNTMGDNLTALFVLGALLVLLARFDTLQPRHALAAGLLAGLGTGLKLTNAVYALALCLALFALAAPLWQRIRLAFVFGIGVLAGMAVTGGWWWWTMWDVFGNPLFPQFNHIFQAPLAAPLGVGDPKWIPQGALEKLLWPFIFTLDWARTSEIRLRHLLWPILYVMFIALALRRTAPAGAGLAPRARFLLAFFALAYLGWMNLFAIYRYLVPVELLSPLVLWILAARLLPARWAGRAAVAAIVLSLVAALPLRTWGYTRWHNEAFRADPVAIARPEQSLVFTVHADPPMGWLAPFFSPKLAFVSLGSAFPESDGYRARVRAMLEARRGPFYLMVMDAGARNGEVLARAREIVGRYGLRVEDTSCRTHAAYIGRHRRLYRMCVVVTTPASV